jgi:hypothetical protein
MSVTLGRVRSAPRPLTGPAGALAGQLLLPARPGQPAVDIAYVSCHNVQIFNGDNRHPQRKDGRPHAAAAQSAPERALSGLEAAEAAASRDK